MPSHLKRLRVSTLVCHAMLSGCVRVGVCVCMRMSAWRIVVKANVPNARSHCGLTGQSHFYCKYRLPPCTGIGSTWNCQQCDTIVETWAYGSIPFIKQVDAYTSHVATHRDMTCRLDVSPQCEHTFGTLAFTTIRHALMRTHTHTHTRTHTHTHTPTQHGMTHKRAQTQSIQV